MLFCVTVLEVGRSWSHLPVRSKVRQFACNQLTHFVSSLSLSHTVVLQTMTTAEEKYTLITRDLQEVLDGDIVQKILAEGKLPKCYWGGYRCTYSQIHQDNLLS